MPGHKEYLKTTMRGMCSMFPDYGMIVVDGNKGPNQMTNEHFSICHALQLPVFYILTKSDYAHPEDL